MNEYIFYTTEGYTQPPIENKEIENCQILGLSFGKNAEEARDNLLKDNNWIIEYGYDIKKIIHRVLVHSSTEELLERARIEIEFLVNLLEKKQLDTYNHWLHERK